MSFIKKNYEKILLGAVLLGLVGTLLFLPVIIGRDQSAGEQMRENLIHPPPQPLPSLDMSREINALNRVQAPYILDFETTNRLFNPMQWEKMADGGWIKIETANSVGPGAVQVVKINPLYFILRLDRFEPANEYSPARYVISIQRENAAIPAQRNPRERFISVGEKNEIFSLVSASGTADNPQLVLQMADSGETVNLAMNKPFRRVDGHAADLKYPPGGKKWNDQRVGADLKIDDGDYIIVVIDPNEVVLSAQSNQKKITLPYQP
jgi:hypothetical protein